MMWGKKQASLFWGTCLWLQSLCKVSIGFHLEFLEGSVKEKPTKVFAMHRKKSASSEMSLSEFCGEELCSIRSIVGIFKMYYHLFIWSPLFVDVGSIQCPGCAWLFDCPLTNWSPPELSGTAPRLSSVLAIVHAVGTPVCALDAGCSHIHFIYIHFPPSLEIPLMDLLGCVTSLFHELWRGLRGPLVLMWILEASHLLRVGGSNHNMSCTEAGWEAR